MSADAHLGDTLEGWPFDLVSKRLSAGHHGDYVRWQAAVDALPAMTVTAFKPQDTVTLEGQAEAAALHNALMTLHPWRKGPFRIGPVFIDTEWRSDWKWARVATGIRSLQGHRVLDIGCGNGYFGWRMLDAGATEVIGIDPTILFCMQHRAIQRYANDPRNQVLPLGIQDIPLTPLFDSVFSMGVIYHRRDPAGHVRDLFALTRPGGQAVLESLVVTRTSTLHPRDRYARMRNVWCVPAVADLVRWMSDAGFQDVRCTDVTATSPDEQRTTPWMTFESLQKALDPDDPMRTVEGHPAPVRAIVVGHRPLPITRHKR